MQSYLILAVLFIIIILWTAVEQKQLTTTKYSAASKRLPKEFDNIGFVVLADLHNYNFGKSNERLIKRIDALMPEFIIVAGDMINKGMACYPSNAYTLLSELAKKYKIYYAYGNHEQRWEKSLNETVENANARPENPDPSWVVYKEKLSGMNVTFLDNESTFHTRNKVKIRITGVSIDKTFFERSRIPAMEEGYLNSLIGEKKGKEYQILIAHNPVYFEEYAKWGADLTISGHLHGGLVRLPGVGGVISPQVRLFPKYSAGNFTNNGQQQMVVSRGLGSHSAMPRMFNAPEIVYITLKNES